MTSLDRVDNIVFDSVDGHALELDLIRPAGAEGPLPLVVYIHAGGWMVGDRRSDAARFERLVAHGFAVASVEYRLSGEAVFPAPLDDVRAAVRWLRDRGPELGVATERIGVWGASAGAHLGMLLAFGPGGAPERGVAAVVGYFGTYELRERAAAGRFAPGAQLPEFVRASGMPWPMRPTFEAMLLGVSEVSEAPELAGQASPVAHAHRSGPPVLMMHGEADGLASPDQSRWMYEAIRDAGGAATLLMIADANHEDERFNRPEVVAATAAFMHDALA